MVAGTKETAQNELTWCSSFGPRSFSQLPADPGSNPTVSQAAREARRLGSHAATHGRGPQGAGVLTQDCSLAQIAKELKKTTATVTGLLPRGLKNLRKAVKELGEP